MRGARGFTLIEVLVALVIVAFGMGAVLATLASAADNTLRLREKSLAEWIGLNQLALARLNRAPLAVGTSEGDVDFANDHWHWQQQVATMEVPGVLRILVQVRRSDAPGSTAGNAAGNAAAGTAGDAWLATVTGFRGDALRTPTGTLGAWDNPNRPQGPGNRNPPTPGTRAPVPLAPGPTTPGPATPGPAVPPPTLQQPP